MAQETVQQTAAEPGGGPAGPPRRARPPLRPVAAVAGALLLFAAFPPLDLWFLAPAGIAATTLSLHGLRPRRAAWTGYLGGVAFLLPALHWVRPIGVDAWLALVAVEALFWAALGAGVGMVTRLPGWPVWTACLWVAQEWARGVFPLGGFPWARVAFSQAESVFTPYAALGGAPLVTFSVVLTGTLLSALVMEVSGARRWRRAVAPALAGAVAVPVAAYAVPRPAADGTTVNIGIIQGNVPGRGMNFLGDEPAVVLRNHANKTHELARAVRSGRLPRPDLVVWPENSTDIDPYRSPSAHAVIDAAVKDIGVPVLVGAVVRAADGAHRHTRSLVWDPGGGPGVYYDKQKLVPFGEFVPLREVLERLFGERVSLVGLQSLPGRTDGDLRLGPVTAGVINCYEVAFDSVVRGTAATGASPLVVQANNATYALSNLPPQQLAMYRLRAVEHGRAVVAAATTGISAYVGPDGAVRWRSAELVDDMTVVRVPVRTAQTIATKIGALPEWVLILVGTSALGVFALRRGKTEVR